MKLEELYQTRQSCRNFRKEPVPHKLLTCLAESARLAPSACNSQPWIFYVAEKPETVEIIAAAAEEKGVNSFVENVSAFIVAVEDKPNWTERFGMKLKDQDFASLDMGLAISQLILRATEEGLSTCMIGLFEEDKIQQALGTDHRVRLVIAVGYAAENDPIRPKKRKSSAKVIRYV